MKILHISPSYFHEDSILGGGERYVDELAHAMANITTHKVTLLSFGDHEKKYKNENVQYIIKKPLKYIKGSRINPLVLSIYNEIKNHDIIHCHQFFNVLTEVVLFYSFLNRKKVFVTDHGGGGTVYFHRLGLKPFVYKFLCVSNYSNKQLAINPQQSGVIYGGCDIEKFRKRKNNYKENHYLSIGRVLPHKGHHLIIKSLKQYESLTIVGKKDESEYSQYLDQLAKDKNVMFKQNLSDQELYQEIEQAQLAIFPSTNIGPNLETLPGEPELFGIAPVEVMATGTKTIVSDIGSYPEIAFNQEHTFSHGNEDALRSALDRVNNLNISTEQYRKHIQDKFTWIKTAERTLSYYKEI